MEDEQRSIEGEAREASAEEEDVGAWNLEDGRVEDRIAKEFIFNVNESDVDVRIADVMGELLHEDDFGGTDLIVERIEEVMLDDAD